jgi:ATP-binding cassette subfamily B protein
MVQGGHYAELYDTYFRHQSLEYVESFRELVRA